MPGPLIGENFGQEQLASNYPFADAASLTTKDGLAFAPTWLLDARIYPVGSAVTVGITSVVVSAASVTINIGDADTPLLCSASFPTTGAVPGRLTLADPAGRLCGMLLVDPNTASALQGWAAGKHQFSAGAAEFVASVVIPRPEIGLRSLAIPGQPPLSGSVWLAGAAGITLSMSGNDVVVQIVGDPLFAQRACNADGTFSAPNPLLSVNSAGPGPSGGFLFVVYDPTGNGSNLRIDGSGTTITFSLAGSSAVLPT